VLRIHFGGLQEKDGVIALAQACGVGRARPGAAVYAHRFDELFAEAPRLWRAAELQDADVVVYAHEHVAGQETARVAKLAQEKGLPCIFFSGSDDPTPVSPPYGVIFRNSILADVRMEAERGMPAFCEDMLRASVGQVAVRKKGQKPVVGFCGFVGTALMRGGYRLTGRTEKVRGLVLRNSVLRALERDPRLECRFIRRAQFWAGAMGRFHNDPQRVAAAHQEFRENLAGTDYTVCLRGTGNFSFRFYEVLSMGRIPFFVNTKCVLPFEEQVDWQKHCVWVENSELERAGEKLAEFHAGLSGEEFEAIQVANRRLWVEWMAPLGFYRRILEEAVSSAAKA